jgi:tripartite-type tricarboxylate transporter receptor subunit TctC
MNDLVAGHLASVMASGPTASSLVREGRIRALALTGAQRTPLDPDVPTIAESGFPGYAATNWYALVVSSKVPEPIVAGLHALLTKALTADEVRAAYAQQGMVTLASSREEAAAHIARETEIWKKLIVDSGLRME